MISRPVSFKRCQISSNAHTESTCFGANPDGKWDHFCGFPSEGTIIGLDSGLFWIIALIAAFGPDGVRQGQYARGHIPLQAFSSLVLEKQPPTAQIFKPLHDPTTLNDTNYDHHDGDD